MQNKSLKFELCEKILIKFKFVHNERNNSRNEEKSRVYNCR